MIGYESRVYGNGLTDVSEFSFVAQIQGGEHLNLSCERYSDWEPFSCRGALSFIRKSLPILEISWDGSYTRQRSPGSSQIKLG